MPAQLCKASRAHGKNNVVFYFIYFVRICPKYGPYCSFLTCIRRKPGANSPPLIFTDPHSGIRHLGVAKSRVVDPYSFFTDPYPDPDPELDGGGQYGSGSGSNTDPGL